MKKILLSFLFLCSLAKLYAQAPTNRGMYFDGVDDHVSINTFPNLNQNFTIEAWVKLYEPITSGQTMPILDKNDGTSGYSFYIKENSGSAQLVLWMNDGLGSTFSNTIPMANLADKGWHHVAVTRGAVGAAINFYLDGGNVGGTNVNNESISAVATTAYIGKRQATSQYFKGQIDELRVFTSTVRTGLDISADMNATGNQGAECFYNFEDDATTGNQTTAANTGSLGTAANANLQASPATPLWALRVSNTNNDVNQGSLRWAITQANTDSDLDYIDFSIPISFPITISPLDADKMSLGSLYTVTKPVFIDGTSQKGYAKYIQMIQINGANLTNTGSPACMNLSNATNSTIKGLHIRNFMNVGVQGALLLSNSSNLLIKDNVMGACNRCIGISASTGTIQGNRLGSTLDGLSVDGTPSTMQYGILITNTSLTVTTLIGGTGAGEGNLIVGFQSGGTANGIRFDGMGSDNVIVRGNIIGLKADLSGTLPNNTGIAFAEGSNNTIGGLGTGQGNIIAGNATRGISFTGGTAVNNIFIGNQIYCNSATPTSPSGQIDINTGNGSQAAPTITAATATIVSGTGEDGGVIHLYKNPANCSTYPTTQVYLGAATVSGGVWSISGPSFAAGDKLVATQTNYAGSKGTSDFSNEFTVGSTSVITDFYTIGNATWNANGNWSNTDGGPDCTCNPAGVAGANVTIKAGHTATVPNATDIAANNNITVEGTLTLNNGNTNAIVLNSASGSIINLNNGNLQVTTATINGIYNHKRNGGIIPNATWGGASECRITGITNTALSGGLAQTFQNFSWNSPLQTVIQNLTGTMIVNGNFNLTSTGSGAFNVGTGSFTANFNSSIGGNFLDNNNVGTNVFNGNVTITTSGTWNTTAVISDGINMRMAGDITHNNSAANSFQAGVIRFVTGGNINGGGTAAKYIIQTLEVTSSGTRTNKHQIELVNMTLIAPNGRLTQGANSILQIKDGGIFSTGIAGQTDFTTNTNTVEYIGGSGDVIADEYHHLTINTTDTKNLTGNIEVRGTLTILDGVLDATNNGYSINIRGNFSVNPTGSFTAGTSTVTFSGTSNTQTIAGTVLFYNLVIDNTHATPLVILGNSISVSNGLNLTNGRISVGGNNLNYSGTEANLTRTNGWVETNGTGVFIKNVALGSFTFPVGSASHYQPITLNSAALGASVRFGTPTAPVPNSGVGSWFVNNLSVTSNPNRKPTRRYAYVGNFPNRYLQHLFLDATSWN